ncbi:MAG: DNA mismatch repair protein MutS, partial [Bacteroidota bacterium]
MKQYLAIKAKYPDAVLLFRVGDFYETFSQDAVIASKVLGITLTARKNGAAATIELAGFPHHSLDTYLPKLVKAGYRVAICDQLENPKETKTIVKRGVTELVTPGVAFNDKVLDHKTNNFLAAIHFDQEHMGISFLDITTGEFFVAQGSKEYIEKLLQGFKPAEVLYQKQHHARYTECFGDKLYTFRLDDWVFTADFAHEHLLKHFGTKSFKGFGVDELPLGIIAAGAAMHYLGETQHEKIGHITALTRIEEDKYVWLDNFTIRNLELVYSTNQNARTLIDVLDHTQTPMGGRLLKRWMVLPLKDLKPIQERLDVVSHFLAEVDSRDDVLEQLRMVGDLERLISKVATARINPREVIQLKKALLTVDPIRELCAKSASNTLKAMADQLNPCKFITDKIETEISDDAPLATNKGTFIKEGIHAELDEYKNISYRGKDYLLQIQERESERTGISSLKISYNNVFGYYISVRNTHKDKVPPEWIRKQTLVNEERYITEELKDYETKILSAEDKIQQIELELFMNLVKNTNNRTVKAVSDKRARARRRSVFLRPEVRLVGADPEERCGLGGAAA